MMQKQNIILILAICILYSCTAYAFDFVYKTKSGTYLYFNIIQSDSIPYTAEVAPYPSNKSYFGNIIVPDTITHNGKLYYITSIAPHAFAKSDKLMSVELPYTLVSIGSNAFRDCIRLQSITFPEHLTYIGGFCFVNCLSLKSIGIPKYVSYIGSFAFGNCKNLHNIYVDIENEHYSTIAGILFDKTGHELILYPATRDGSRFEIPEFVYFIDDWAFCSAKNLKDVIIPESVVSIGKSAFWGCKLLTTINIPYTIDVIRSHTFYDCKSLALVYISRSTKIVSNAIPSYTRIEYTPRRPELSEEEEQEKPKPTKKQQVDTRPTDLEEVVWLQYSGALPMPDKQQAANKQQTAERQHEVGNIQQSTGNKQPSDNIIQTPTTIPFIPKDINIEEVLEQSKIFGSDFDNIEISSSPTGDDDDDVVIDDDVDKTWAAMDEEMEEYLQQYEKEIIDESQTDSIYSEHPENPEDSKDSENSEYIESTENSEGSADSENSENSNILDIFK